MLLELKETGCCVVISTHLMEHVEKLCDAICLIDGGRSVLQGRLAEVKKRFGTNTVLIEYDGDVSFLEELDFVTSFDDYGKYVEARLTDPQRAQELLTVAAELVQIRRFELMEPTLHGIFIEDGQGRQSVRRLFVVIKREYLTRVKTKGFIISTIATPLFILVVMVLPSVMAARKPEKPQQLGVIAPAANLVAELEQTLDRKTKKGDRIYTLQPRITVEEDPRELKEELRGPR